MTTASSWPTAIFGSVRPGRPIGPLQPDSVLKTCARVVTFPTLEYRAKDALRNTLGQLMDLVSKNAGTWTYIGPTRDDAARYWGGLAALHARYLSAHEALQVRLADPVNDIGAPCCGYMLIARQRIADRK